MSARSSFVGALAAGAAYVVTAIVTSLGLLRLSDVALLHFAQSAPSYPLDVAGSALSALGGLPVTIATAVMLALAWVNRDRRRGATPLALGLVIALGIITQRLVPQPGPPIETLRDFHWLALSGGDSLSSQAFPSGHVARTAFLAFLLAGRHPSTTPVMAALVGAMAVSRVYIGSHWASDVVGGLFLGASISLLCIAVRSRTAARGLA